MKNHYQWLRWVVFAGLVLTALHPGFAQTLRIRTADLLDLVVTTAKIDNSAVTSAKIADGTVATVDLDNLAVTTGKIANAAVTNDKLAADSVTNVKVLNTTLTTDKLSTAGSTSGYVIKNVGGTVTWAPDDTTSGGGVFVGAFASTTVTWTSGAVSIAPEAPASVMVFREAILVSPTDYTYNAGASTVTPGGGAGWISGDKITVVWVDEGGLAGGCADGDKGDITSATNCTDWQIDAGVVGTNEIATDGVGSAEIAADAVGSSEIAADAVGSSEIAADAVGASELAATAVSAGTCGSTTQSCALTVDADGRITAMSNSTIASAQPPIAFSFTANGSGYFVADQAYSLTTANESGTGTLAYEVDTGGGFASDPLPITLAAGNVLKVTLTGISGYKAVTLE